MKMLPADGAVSLPSGCHVPLQVLHDRPFNGTVQMPHSLHIGGCGACSGLLQQLLHPLRGTCTMQWVTVDQGLTRSLTRPVMTSGTPLAISSVGNITLHMTPAGLRCPDQEAALIVEIKSRAHASEEDCMCMSCLISLLLMML